MRLWLISLFGLLILTLAARSTAGQNTPVVGLRADYGFIILHSQSIRPIGKSYPWGLSVDISRHYKSAKAYNSCLCFPRLGLSTTFWEFDNPKVLGQGLTSVFFIEPFFGAHNKLSFSFRSGLGLAYANRPYDAVHNPDNLSYSTRISFALLVGANINVRLNPHTMLRFAGNYNHISNGGMNEPNTGINYPTFSLGLDYYLHQQIAFTPFFQDDWKSNTDEKSWIFVHAFASAKQLSGSDKKNRYPIFGLLTEYWYRVSRINALSAGLEIMSNHNHRKEIQRAGLQYDHKKAGLLVGNVFLLGKFNFSQQFGIYLYDPYRRNAAVYQRYGLDWKFAKSFTTGIGLKAHGHVADFLEFRLGLLF
jgi:hypothetical protein